ncbi:MAG: extracellular solute-binding protein [Clostridiales bacterium]|nr:extracellular solute-binding protein [Clostridiales bacterium]
MKKILSILLAVLFILVVFTGCTQNTSGTPSDEGDKVKKTESDKGTEGDEEPAKPVELTLYQLQPGIVDQIQEICDMYKQENPNVTIKSDRPGDDYFNIIKTMFASGQGPDIFSLNPWTMVEDYATAGLIVDLSNEAFVGRLTDAAKPGVTIDGKIYALPMEIAGLGITYNRSIFEKYNLKPPKTISELESVCKTLKDNGITPFAFSLKETWELRHLFSMGHTPTVDIVKFKEDMNAGQTSFNNEKMDEVFRAFDVIKANGPENPFDYDYNMQCALMGEGKAAMFATGLWCVDMIRKIDPEFNPGIFALPISENPDDAKLSIDVNSVYCINSKSDAVDKCKKFFDWLSSEEIASVYAQKTNTIPAVKNVKLWEGADEAFNDVVNYANSGNSCPWGFSIWPTGLDDEIGTALQQYYTNEISKDQLFETIDSKWADFKQ